MHIGMLVTVLGFEKARDLVTTFAGQRVPSVSELLKYERKMRAVQDYLNKESPHVICMRYQIELYQLYRWVKVFKKQREAALDAAAKVVDARIGRVK